MFRKIAAAVKNAAVGWVHSIGDAFKRRLQPARIGTRPLAAAARDAVRPRSELVAENALLRHQLVVLRRGVRRPRLHDGDRLTMVLLASLNDAWPDALHLVKPETLLRWHRDLFRWFWRRKSRRRGRQPRQLARETIELIMSMARDNVTWGAERIRGELLKLGIRVSKRTIQKYVERARPRREPGQTWRAFLDNHADVIWACDFLQLYDVLFRPIFAFFIVKHGTREVVHFGVTRSPTDAWAAQQLREATPFGEGPRYLIRDNDGKFGQQFAAVAESTGIEIVRIPPRSPDLNSICERFLGSVRRECLDHVVILCEDHLHRVLREYVTYHAGSRPHQGLGQRIPSFASVGPPANEVGEVVAVPVLGGLHHDYRRAA